MVNFSKGDLVLVNLEPVKGSEQGGTRPALIIQNNILNVHSPTIIVAPITSRIYSKKYPTNVQFFSSNSGLKEKSTILLNQIRTIDKKRIIKKIGKLDEELIKEVNLAIKVSLSIN
ncbi:PemK family transcriptional regulator [Candidatus Pacearchaeota archaeon CG09_land_8_20_14_0_10_30_9]|nr:MAG: PemK family transcriptional regulator [Candidatus Pacearchaeota archaeon CG1_02_30_18]PIN71764.1 MAG: PemK family transcriptional regulator [Candidatus Pacearchaeota archaeon CG11_big_fil_rev_8_21_14_0_20_30_13]PIO00749.1 MAG: PemK family transcriptional regulator [Candidatus Pacearchaeota archaeon CG09_land_8_20_14_0_10_30_9]